MTDLKMTDAQTDQLNDIEERATKWLKQFEAAKSAYWKMYMTVGKTAYKSM